MTTSKKIVAPDAITNVEMMLNLNGNDKPITKAFSFLKHTDDAAPYVPNPATYNSVVSMNIADQNGNDHVFSTYFVKTAVKNEMNPFSGEITLPLSEWNAYIFLDGRNIDTNQASDSLFFSPPPEGQLGNNTNILPEGELTANPFKLSFDTDGKLVKVDDVNAPSFFGFKEDSAEQLAEYAVTHEPIPASYELLTTTRVFFHNTRLSEINPSLKYFPEIDLDSLDMSFAVDFANSTQFATPFTVNSLQQTWQLRGTDENDTISGSMGDDSMIGSWGIDKMTGGLGADTFIFYNAEETGLTAKTRDIITDFKHSDGDKID
ncbi:MAG: flagellar basal body FlgE domain-containing protein, partial [Methylococcaceae bacterium]